MFLGLGIYAGSVYLKAKNAFDKTYDPKTAVKQDSFSGKESFNILLLGTDTGAFGRKRSSWKLGYNDFSDRESGQKETFFDVYSA